MDNITPINVTESMKRFIAMLDQYPKIKSFWYVDNGSYRVDLEQIENNIGLLSSGENIMLLFFLSVFTGQQQPGLELDIITAARTLSQRQLDMIAGWLKDPFFP